MSPLLDVKGLTKRYAKSARPALSDVSFSVESGAIYAFVGPNGAGKTTTIRILATLLKPDAGDVHLAGYALSTHPREFRALIGYIPDEFGLYDELSVRDYLAFFARCYGIPASQHASLTADLLDLVGLAPRADDAVRTLSRGMKQRLGLARALVHDPQLIIADEPASGLDPRARVELRDILRALRDMGKTVFISSHVLRELDDVATHVGIIEQGRVLISGPMDVVRAQLQGEHRTVTVYLAGPVDDAHAWLQAHPLCAAVERVETNGMPALRVQLSNGEDQASVMLLAALVHAGFPVRQYIEEKHTLESLFLILTQGGVT